MRWISLIALSALAAVADAHIQFGDVPVYNFEASLFSGQEDSQVWGISVKTNVHNDVLKALCEEASECIASGHPDEGGMSFITIKAKPSEVEALALKHGKEFLFIEPSMEVRISDDWDPNHDYNIQEFKMPPMNVSLLQTQRGDTPLWGLDRIDDTEGLDGDYTPPSKYKGGEGVHVYVLDTGVLTTHQEFGGRAIPLLDSTSSVVVPCNGDVNCGHDDVGHGTHCAGTVGGQRTGVAPKATIYNAKVLGKNGGTTTGIMAAMDWIIASKSGSAHKGILSMSLGGQGRSTFMENAVDRATAAGFLVVVAAGNYDRDSCYYQPAFVESAFNVGATDDKDRRATFSNYGTCNNIFAPGVAIGSAMPPAPETEGNDQYAKMDGTSMACPHVAGAAALLLAKNPQARPADLKIALKTMSIKGKVTDLKDSPDMLLYIGSEESKPTPKPDGPGGSDECKCPKCPSPTRRRRGGTKKSRRRRRGSKKPARPE